jgi:hypothetical protein
VSLVLGQDRAQVPFAEDQSPVGDLGPGCEHEPFRVGVRARTPRRDLDRFDPGIGQDCVERGAELPGPVPDQEPQLDVDQLTGSAPGLLATLPPLEALRRWTTDLVSAMRRKHGLGDALSPCAYRSITEQTYGPVIAAITQLLDAGKRDGTIRADADPGDFLQLTGALWRAASGPEDRSQPMLGLILDGLTTRQQR